MQDRNKALRGSYLIMFFLFHFNNVFFLRFKSIKWWAQSFIVGIPQIIAGYRDDQGMVSELKTIDVNKLRKESEVSGKGLVYHWFLNNNLFVNIGLLEVKHLHEFLSAVFGICP